MRKVTILEARQKESLFFVSDSTIGAFEDSVAITEKDSIKSLPDLDIVSKARFGMASFTAETWKGQRQPLAKHFVMITLLLQATIIS